MNSKLLNELISNKNIKISLDDSIKKHPYFLIPKIFHLLSMDNKKENYFNYLNNVALYVTERSHLKQKLLKTKKNNFENEKNIIDKFITSSPKIKKNNNNGGSNKDLANSKKEINDVITENMAIIYANQNKLNESINIYKKLIVKFPKKRTYFANEIKKLKK